MPPVKSVPVSVLVLARNEEAAIGDCLRSAAFAREAVVVDAGSTDRTREVARDLGARVVETNWPGDYGAARSRAESFASCDWVFQLDADERVSPELADEIGAFFARGDHENYPVTKIPLKDIAFGKWIRHGGWYPQHKKRLYRKGSGTWTGRVHERFETEAPIRVLEGAIVHESFTSVAVVIDKINRYSTLDAATACAEGHRFSLFKLFFVPLERFFGRYVRHGGWRDGFHGFVLAALIGLNYFFRHLKIWEARKREREEARGPGKAGGP